MQKPPAPIWTPPSSPVQNRSHQIKLRKTHAQRPVTAGWTVLGFLVTWTAAMMMIRLMMPAVFDSRITDEVRSALNIAALLSSPFILGCFIVAWMRGAFSKGLSLFLVGLLVAGWMKKEIDLQMEQRAGMAQEKELIITPLETTETPIEKPPASPGPIPPPPPAPQTKNTEITLRNTAGKEIEALLISLKGNQLSLRAGGKFFEIDIHTLDPGSEAAVRAWHQKSFMKKE